MLKKIMGLAIAMLFSICIVRDVNAEEGHFKESTTVDSTTQQKREAELPTPNIKNARIQNGWFEWYGEWMYIKDGYFVFNNWVKDNGHWYFFDDYGYMVRDTSYYIDGKEYFFGSDGRLRKGWSKVIYQSSAEWIYSDSSGVIKKSSWIKDRGKWYYMDSRGIMVHNEVYNIFGKRYFFKPDGVMATNGWATDGYDWFYADKSGYLKRSSWLKSNNHWYYFDEYGYMIQNQISEIGGHSYYFKSNGIMATNGWATDGYDWFYASSSGSLYTNKWLKLNNCWYFFDMYGYMARGIAELNGQTYYFNENGVMKTGWIKELDGDGDAIWMYADQSGYLFKEGWKKINNIWYYFSDYGMVKNSWVGNDYYVDENGYMVKGWKSIECDYYGYGYHSFYFENNGRLARNKQIGNYWINEYGYYGSDAHPHY